MVNCVLNPTHTVSAINIAVGFGLTIILSVVVCVHPLSSVTVNVTLYVPYSAYVYVGFGSADVPINGSPNSHSQVIIVPDPFIDKSVNVVGNV